MLSFILIVAAATDVAARQRRTNAYQFVGFSDESTNLNVDTIDGGKGRIKMNALCQDDYGISARMCTQAEFWVSPNAVGPSARGAWVHSRGRSIDLSSRVTCAGWVVNWASRSALAVLPSGKFGMLGCDNVLPVTCCARNK